jgi:hypothetical protein
MESRIACAGRPLKRPMYLHRSIYAAFQLRAHGKAVAGIVFAFI